MYRTFLFLSSSLLLGCSLAAQQATFTNAGGSVSLGSDFVISGSSLASPSGTLSFDCPVTALPPGQYSAEWVCNGGSVSIISSDGLTSVTGSVMAGTLIETASGGGRGHGITYYYSFSGTFTGTMTLNGATLAVRGVTTQAVAPLASPLGTGTIGSGLTTVNADYEPLYITDTYNNRVVKMDNMNGDNWTTLGTPGSGAKQFNLPWGIYLDAKHRIYVTDSGNCRITRMDDMSGKNWTSLGTCGSGTLQFNNAGGIFVAPSGTIYIADTGNDRVVQIADMTGANWTVLGSSGSATGQFSKPTGVAVDTAGKIYVSDGGNDRIVRFDDMSGANWIALGSSGTGVNQFATPQAISLDRAGKIYVVDIFNSRIVRMDDLSGTNWTVLGGSFGSGFAQFINPYGATVDPYGSIFIADSRNYRLVLADDMTGSGWTPYGTGGTGVGQFDSPTTIFAAPSSAPIAVPVFSASSLSFSNTVIGTPSASQSISITNIGSSPLEIGSIAASGDFAQTNTCGSALPVGQTCSLTVTFTPTAPAARSGSITINSTSVVKTIRLKGVGTLVSVSPTSLSFGNVNAGGRGVSMDVTVANPGAAPAGISSVTLKAAPVYFLVNHCPAVLAPNTTCTATVKFYPQNAAIYNGSLSITDASGVVQKVSVTGTGVSN